MTHYLSKGSWTLAMAISTLVSLAISCTFSSEGPQPTELSTSPEPRVGPSREQRRAALSPAFVRPYLQPILVPVKGGEIMYHLGGRAPRGGV